MMLLTLALACKDPVDADSVDVGGESDAPTDLNGLTAYMFREWDNEDISVLVTGLENIESIAAEFPVDDSNYANRSFEGVQALTEDDVSDVELTHGYNPNDATGVALFYQSAFTVDDHVGVFLLADQTPVEASSPFYERTITDGEDCFPNQECETMASENDVERKNILVDTEQQILKVWRWVELADGRMAIAGRTWQPALADSEKEDKIYQNYSVEMWIPNDAGTLRFFTTWSQNSFEFADVLILGSVNDAMNVCEDYLAE